MVHSFLAAAATPPSSGITPTDYLIIGCVTALAMTVPGILAWHSAAKGRKESRADVGLQNLSLTNKFEEIGLNFQRMDLQFLGLNDTMGRHLEHHRVAAEIHLPALLEAAHVNNTNPDTNS